MVTPVTTWLLSTCGVTGVTIKSQVVNHVILTKSCYLINLCSTFLQFPYNKDSHTRQQLKALYEICKKKKKIYVESSCNCKEKVDLTMSILHRSLGNRSKEVK